MKKCPRCGTRFDGALCPRCRAEADNAPPPLVEVYVAHGEIDAQVVRSLLDAHGIDCFLTGESIRRTFGLTVDGLGEVRLFVRAADEEAARDLIASREP